MILTKEEIVHALADYMRISRAAALILIESIKVMIDAVEKGRQEIYFPKDTPQNVQDDILKGYASVETDKLKKKGNPVEIIERKNLTGTDQNKIFEILMTERKKNIKHSSLRLKTLVPCYTINQYSNVISRFSYHMKNKTALHI